MARCERCLGTGVDIGPDYERGCFGRIPCHECQGSGIVSCCDTAGAYGVTIKDPNKAYERWTDVTVGDPLPTIEIYGPDTA